MGLFLEHKISLSAFLTYWWTERKLMSLKV